jgi:hypothetical protein
MTNRNQQGFFSMQTVTPGGLNKLGKMMPSQSELPNIQLSARPQRSLRLRGVPGAIPNRQETKLNERVDFSVC